MYTVNDYKPPKPFFKMSINDLLKYNKKCQKIDKYLFSRTRKKKKGGRKTRNKKNRKTRKRKKKNKTNSLQRSKIKSFYLTKRITNKNHTD